MSLNCIDSSKFQLIYGEITYGSLNNYTWDGSKYAFVQNIKPRNGGRLTWKYEEAIYRRKIYYYGTAILKSYNKCNQNVYWYSRNGSNYYHYDNSSPVEYEKAWKIIANREHEDGTTTTQIGSLKRINIDDYQAIENSDTEPKAKTTRVSLTVPLHPGCHFNNRGNDVSDVIVSGTRRKGVAYWKATIYEDGEYYDDILKPSPDNDDRFDPPAKILEGVDPDESERTVLDFDKASNTQGVEVVIDSEASHRKLLFLVDLDEGVEVGRTLVYSFESEPGEPPPEHEIVCIIDKCPENTCKVDCGTHYCCYGSDGIAVHSFLK